MTNVGFALERHLPGVGFEPRRTVVHWILNKPVSSSSPKSCSGADNILMPLSPDLDIPTSTLQSNHSFNLEEARKIQVETKAQAACDKWLKEREGRLKASNFGMIMKRKKVSEQFIQAT